MKKLFTIIVCIALFTACNENAGEQKLEDPNETHPVTESIPDSMTLVNDSVVMPETIGDKSSPQSGDSVNE